MPVYKTTDPYLAKLRQLANEYHTATKQTESIRRRLDKYVQELKGEGYSYPVLAKNTRLSQGTIQNIIAKAEVWE